MLSDKEQFLSEALTRVIEEGEEDQLLQARDALRKRLKKISSPAILQTRERVAAHMKKMGIDDKRCLVYEQAGKESAIYSPLFAILPERNDIIIKLSRGESADLRDFTIVHELAHSFEKGGAVSSQITENHQDEFDADKYAIDYFIREKNVGPIACEITDRLTLQSESTFTHPACVDRARVSIAALNTFLDQTGETMEDLLKPEDRRLSEEAKQGLQEARENFPSRRYWNSKSRS